MTRSNTIKDLLDEKIKERANKSALEKVSASSLKDKSANEVINDLKEIERKGAQGDNLDAPESLNLQKVEFEEKTDEDINELAKNSLESKYKTSIISFSKRK